MTRKETCPAVSLQSGRNDSSLISLISELGGRASAACSSYFCQRQELAAHLKSPSAPGISGFSRTCQLQSTALLSTLESPRMKSDCIVQCTFPLESGRKSDCMFLCMLPLIWNKEKSDCILQCVHLSVAVRRNRITFPSVPYFDWSPATIGLYVLVLLWIRIRRHPIAFSSVGLPFSQSQKISDCIFQCGL